MLAIFDTEGVLIDGEFLPELAKITGKEKEILDITNKGINGEINWEEGLLERVNKLLGISYEECIKTADQLPIMNGAKETFDTLRKLGFTTLTVSGGPDILVNRVKSELKIDYAISNQLIFVDEKLNGIKLKVGSNKVNAIKSILNEINEKKDNIVTTVDGANDIALFEIAGLKISFNGIKMINEKSDSIILEKDLRKIIPIIKEKFELV